MYASANAGNGTAVAPITRAAVTRILMSSAGYTSPSISPSISTSVSSVSSDSSSSSISGSIGSAMRGTTISYSIASRSTLMPRRSPLRMRSCKRITVGSSDSTNLPQPCSSVPCRSMRRNVPMRMASMWPSVVRSVAMSGSGRSRQVSAPSSIQRPSPVHTPSSTMSAWKSSPSSPSGSIIGSSASSTSTGSPVMSSMPSPSSSAIVTGVTAMRMRLIAAPFATASTAAQYASGLSLSPFCATQSSKSA